MMYELPNTNIPISMQRYKVNLKIDLLLFKATVAGIYICMYIPSTIIGGGRMYVG